jgi:hypothetical protein
MYMGIQYGTIVHIARLLFTYILQLHGDKRSGKYRLVPNLSRLKSMGCEHDRGIKRLELRFSVDGS